MLYKIIGAILLVGLGSWFCTAAVFSYGEDVKSYRDISLSPPTVKLGVKSSGMRPDAEEVADLLNVRGLAEKIRSARDLHESPMPRAVEQARLICLYRLFIASEETRKAVAVIDFELAKSNQNLGALSAKRDAARNMITTLNFAQGGSAGIVKNSLSFIGGAKLPVRQEIAMSSFGTSIGLSILNLLLPSVWGRQIDSAPNSLAQVFTDSVRPDDANRSYLWKFLNSPVPGSSDLQTRRQILLKHLETISQVDPQDSKTINKIAALPDPGRELDENIKVLNKRINLLYDLETHIEEFDAALFEFHQAITLN